MFTLGRKIDLSYKPNLLIVVFALILATGAWLFSSEIWLGVSLGIGVFLTWALTRELDPVHDYSAFIAVVLSLFMLMNIESIQFIPLFWLLLLLRSVNNITGKKLTLFDLASLLSITGFLSFNQENPIYLFLLALAMICIRQTGNKTKKVLLAEMLSFILFFTQSFLVHSLIFNSLENLDILNFLLIGVAVFSPAMFWFLSKENIENDKGNQANRTKIFTSQLFYCVSLLLFVFFTEISFANQVIYLSMIVGVFLHFIGAKKLSSYF